MHCRGFRELSSSCLSRLRGLVRNARKWELRLSVAVEVRRLTSRRGT